MPLFFLLIGIVLIAVAINNRVSDLASLLKEDFAPSSGTSFTTWIIAIVAVGLVGNVKELRPVANMFLALIIVVLLLSNKGFFATFSKDIRNS